MSNRTITHVAIIYKGKTYTLPRPNRHYHVIELIANETGVETIESDIQGFLNDKGKFLSRKNALMVALKAGQVLDPDSIRAGQLFSEDIW